jgi:hypothetical protein
MKIQKNCLKEKDIQKNILEYLEIKRIFHYRNNTGSFVSPTGGYYSFGATGSPDIICVINGIYTGLEVKRPKGKQSENQKIFQDNLEKAGGKYYLVYSLDDVIKII